MSKPWKVRRGIYELADDSRANRKELVKHLTAKFKKDGFKPKAILYGKDKIPQRIGTGSLAKIQADPKNEKLKLQIKTSNPDRLRGSDIEQQTSKEKAIEGFRKQDIDKGRLKINDRSTTGPVKDIQAHHKRMLQMYRPFFEGLSKEDVAALADFAFDSKYALGNDISNRALLSKPFHDEIHDFMRKRGYQVSSAKIKKGYKYPGVPDLGNTFESRKNALSHFFKNVQEPIEAKLSDITWNQEDKIKPFTKDQLDQAAAHFNDPDERLTFDQRQARKTDSKWDWQVDSKGNRIKVPRNIETTEVGGRLGGIGNKLKVDKTRKLDAALNIGSNLATGNIAGAGIQAGTLATTEALKTKAAQKALAKQIAKITAKRAGKSALKLIPGLDIGISAKEAFDYAKQGKWDQAGISTLSGAVGWIPGIGDAASAGLDLTNTGLDISRLHINSQNKTKNKNNVEAPKRRLKLNY